MPNLATGILNSVNAFADTVTGVFNALNPIAQTGLSVYNAFAGGGGGGGGRGTPAGAYSLPGGAPNPYYAPRASGVPAFTGGIGGTDMPMLPTSPMARQAFSLQTPLFQMDTGTPTAAGTVRNPKLHWQPRPSGRGMDLYVKAPSYVYNVTVRNRRRCRGGR